MCGICGAVNFDPKGRIEKEYVTGMMSKLRHRGPDDEGLFCDDKVALGHRRLSIIDLDGGRQPIFNEDRSVCIVVNGEIYNYKELRSSLKGRHAFSTRSDSEVIVHLWEDHGDRCVDFLRGMFAFALYDINKRKVFLARDRFGKKPLVYADTKEGFFFCSEIYPLTGVPQVDAALSLRGLDEFLSLHYVPAPRTIFNGIRKLEPAYTLKISPEGIESRRYWAIDPFARVADSYEAAEKKISGLIEASVRYRMIADVPVGAFLSGGVDSSVIVGAMRANAAEADVETVCIGYDERGYDERQYAQHVAQRFRTRHHVHVVRPDVLNVLPKLVRHYGEPYGDPSAIPTWYLSQVTSEHVKVALSGDGGDEMFAGYNRFDSTRLVEFYHRLPARLRSRFIEAMAARLPQMAWGEGYLGQLKQFMKGASRPPVERLVLRNSVFSPDIKNDLYSNDLKTALRGFDSSERFSSFYETLNGLSETEKLHYLDLGVFLPDDILTKVDIASMAHGLEVRSPFLDHVLAEYVLSLPFEFKHKVFRRKRILKSVGRRFLRPEFLNRKKMGFRIPVGLWFRTSLKDALLKSLTESPIFADSGLFKMGALKRMYDEHQSGRINHAERLWNLWFLGEWSKQGNVNWTA
jgi:asparagine synthase (glutamine-hydrolysing)